MSHAALYWPLLPLAVQRHPVRTFFSELMVPGKPHSPTDCFIEYSPQNMVG